MAKKRHPDARVVLLEARTVGWAASGRNGGFCEANLTHGEENGRDRFNTE
jgi:glycine/D-amino acid oxidase-like deaminating enzyme